MSKRACGKVMEEEKRCIGGRRYTPLLCASVPEMQIFRVLQTGVDELFELTVDFWHKLGEGELLGEGKLEEIEQKIKGLSEILLRFYIIQTHKLKVASSPLSLFACLMHPDPTLPCLLCRSIPFPVQGPAGETGKCSVCTPALLRLGLDCSCLGPTPACSQ